MIASLAASDGLMTADSNQVYSLNRRSDQNIAELITMEQYKILRSEVQQFVQTNFTMEEIDPAQSRKFITRNKFNSLAHNKIRELEQRGIFKIDAPDMPVIAARLFSDILGYGPLEEHFDDKDVTEIKVNGANIRVEKHGVEQEVEEKFESPEDGVDLIRRMIIKSGKHIDQATPRVNARLHDGSRMIAQIAPIAVDNLLITIRRFKQDINRQQLIDNKAANRDVMNWLEVAVKIRSNMLVSGGTSSGKTTWLNVLASFIEPSLSIITIEDPAELQLQHPDVRRLETRDANIEGKGQYTLSDGVKDALRMAPDIIILGECRREEALDMLQAMNTGHEGSLGTAHANSAQHTIQRLAYMVSMAESGLPYEAIIDQIADALDFIVYVRQDRTGRRRLDHIVEVIGTQNINGKYDVKLNTLWQYNRATDTWDWVADKFYRAEEFIERGGWHA